MKKLCKKFALILLSILVLFVLFVSVERFRGKRAYKKVLSELQAKGEVLDVKELLPHKPVETENAAIELLALSKQMPELPRPMGGGIPCMFLVEPGWARPSYTFDSWRKPSLIEPNGNDSYHWDSVKQSIENCPVSLQQIQTALAKPSFNSGFSYTNGFSEKMVLSEYFDIGGYLAALTMKNLKESNTDEAVKCLQSLLRLVALMEDERLIITQLIRSAISTVSFQLTWDILTMPNLSAAQCRSLIGAWRRIEFIQPMATSLEMERAMAIDVFAKLRVSLEECRRHFGERENIQETVPGYLDLPTSGWVLHRLHIPLWRFAWMDQDFTYGIQRWNNVIEPARLAWTDSWASASWPLEDAMLDDPVLNGNFLEDLSWYTRFRFPLSANVFTINAVLIKRTMRHQTEQQMAMAALALHSYKLRMNSYPESLNELVPEYLSESPRDYMDGQILRYQKTEDGDFLLYSVGDDAVKAGGIPNQMQDADDYLTIWDGKDAVWPRLRSFSADRVSSTR